MECSYKNHRRADCPAYKKILEANGGQRPVGHMGDFEKARKALPDKHGKPQSESPARGNGKSGSRKTHVKGLVDEDHEDPGNVSDRSASSCGSAHMKAMVADGQCCTTVFGCRLAGPDDFKLAKKTCRSKRLCDPYSKNISNALEASD